LDVLGLGPALEIAPSMDIRRRAYCGACGLQIRLNPTLRLSFCPAHGLGWVPRHPPLL
jgi:hypothetical protein